MALRTNPPFLLHTSAASYSIGHQLGPLPAGARMPGLSVAQLATEIAIDAACPSGEPSRLSAVFATAHMDLVHTLLRHNPALRVYRVEIAPGAKACGPLDMRYVDWMTRNGTAAPHPADYWAGKVSPLRVPSWEIVAEAIVVVAEADALRVAKAAKQSSGIPLRLTDLFDP
jgi:hypothetical protein